MKDKIPYYEFVNMFFPGATFSLLMFALLFEKIYTYSLFNEILAFCKDWSVIIGSVALIMMYEVGFVLNRLGAITVGYFLEKTKIWPRGKYSANVSKLEKENPKFRKMNIELHVARTHVAMYIVLAIVATILGRFIVAGVFCGIATVFVIGGCRTNAFMNAINENNSADEAPRK